MFGKEHIMNERQRTVLKEENGIYTKVHVSLVKSRLHAFITHESARTHRCKGAWTSEGPRKQKSSSAASSQPFLSYKDHKKSSS